ncbi:hypothetical protein OG21DRAFT_636695 [Imleria badia]|nr:hypothetical protein OG21DRAFT_636695 [Imleria badia]
MSIPSNSIVKLWLCFDNQSKLALSIPLTQCTTFATSPLKWLRFLGFAIYGREGYLSKNWNGLQLDYTEQIEARSYYFRSDDEPCFVDFDVIDNKTGTSSEVSSSHADFRQRGDNYMSNLVDSRGETYGPMDPVLNSTNDTRNRILLYVGFHGLLDKGYVAFLKTPNFALTVDDIPSHQPLAPNAGHPGNRLTLQHIQPSQLGGVLPQLVPHNSDAWQPQDISQCPVAIIVDLVYAAAVLQAWGSKSFIEYVWRNSKGSYYESGMEDDDGGEASGDLTTQVPQAHQPEPTPRAIRYDRRSGNKAQDVNPADQPTMGDMLDVILALWTRAAREGERGPQSSDAADVADNENKTRIQTWLQSVEESTS